MPTLLVKVTSNNVTQSPGRWLAGEIVQAFADGHEFGSAEVPEAGNFYHVNITNATLEQVRDYLQGLHHEPTTNIDATNGSGGYRITITSTMVSTSGRNAITREQMDGFIGKWGGMYHSHTNSSYTFDISAYLAGTSEGFWGNIGQTTFEDAGFVGGVQQIKILSSNYSNQQIAQAVVDRGGEIVNAQQKIFSIAPAILYAEFREDIEEGWRNIMHKRRRWSISSAGMTYLANNGGVFTGTAAQIAPFLQDGLDD
jgi:hypothetical protein